MKRLFWMGRLLDDSRGLHFKVPSCFWMAWLHSLMKGLWFPAVTAAAFTIRLTMGGHDKYFWPQYTHNSSAPANFVNYYCSQMQNINHRMHLAFGFTGYPYDDDSFHLFDFLLWLFEYEKDVLNQDHSFTLFYSRTPDAVFENSILTKPQHFHEFFTPNVFDNFSREIKVVNS